MHMQTACLKDIQLTSLRLVAKQLWVAACRVQPAICGLQESSEPGTGMDPALAPKAVTMCTASLVATKIPSCSRYQDFCMA